MVYLSPVFLQNFFRSYKYVASYFEMHAESHVGLRIECASDVYFPPLMKTGKR